MSPDDAPVLLDEAALTESWVVANNSMNRERQLSGVNSYARELGIDPLHLVESRLREARTASTSEGRPVAWLDLCCGSGRALVQTAHALQAVGRLDGADLVGVDLVDTFVEAPVDPGLRLVGASVTDWRPDRTFDLITCVHGLHYVGDKLGVLARAASWLTGDGRLIADFDVAAVRRPDGRPIGRPLAAALRSAGFSYDARRRLISRTGGQRVHLPYEYLGADDQAGPNYTGQPAVHSYYRPV